MPAAAEFADKQKKILQEVQAALRDAKLRMKANYDKHTRPAATYEKNTLVWLDGRNLKTERPSEKLEHLRYGPFKVLKKVGASSYKLDIPPTWTAKRVHNVFNERLLIPYVAPFFPGQVVPPPDPPVIIDGEEEYDVERILDSKFQRRGRGGPKLKFLVKWLNYSNKHNLGNLLRMSSTLRKKLLSSLQLNQVNQALDNGVAYSRTHKLKWGIMLRFLSSFP